MLTMDFGDCDVQCRFIQCNRWTILLGDADNRGDCAYVEEGGV